MNLQEYKNFNSSLQQKSKKPSKYKNIKTIVDGITFDSKGEADYYKLLKVLQKTGEVLHFERQLKFKLCKGCSYILDFKVTYKDHSTRYLDFKGFETPVSKLKRKFMLEIFGIKVEIVTRKDL